MQQKLSNSVEVFRAAFGRDVRERLRNGERVVPVHEAVPRRLRLYVAGLKGAEPLRREVEERLRQSGLIERVAASALTGTVLVVFPVTRPRIEIISYIERALHSRDDRAGSFGVNERTAHSTARSEERSPMHFATWRLLVCTRLRRALLRLQLGARFGH